jgi:hypothetical protein
MDVHGKIDEAKHDNVRVTVAWLMMITQINNYSVKLTA